MNPYRRELAGGASQYKFTGELQSGAFLLVSSLKNGGDIVNNPKWHCYATRVVPRLLARPFFEGGAFFDFEIKRRWQDEYFR